MGGWLGAKRRTEGHTIADMAAECVRAPGLSGGAPEGLGPCETRWRRGDLPF